MASASDNRVLALHREAKEIDDSQRGFLKMTFTTTEAKGEWFFVNTISQHTYTPTLGYAKTMSA